MNGISRRVLLAGTATTALAGCLFDDDERSESTLGVIAIHNRHEEVHSVDVRVEWDGELVHDRTYSLEENDPGADTMPGVAVERTWPEESGRFTVSARIIDGEWRSVDPADHDYPECFTVDIFVDRSGETLYMSTRAEDHLCTEQVIESVISHDDNESDS